MESNKVIYRYIPGVTSLDQVKRHAEKCQKRTGQQFTIRTVPHDGIIPRLAYDG